MLCILVNNYMSNYFSDLYFLIEGRYEGGKLKGVSKKSVMDLKRTIKKAGLSDRSEVRKDDMENANRIVREEYNTLYDRIKDLLLEFSKTKNYKTLILNLQKMQIFWNQNARINAILKSSHAPVRHAIYKELMKVNKELPYSTNQYGFPVYPFHLIPVFVLKDILLSNPKMFSNISDSEKEEMYSLISNKLNLDKDQKAYLSSTKSSLGGDSTEEEDSGKDLFSVL